MRKTIKLIIVSAVICLLPVSIISAQNKKNEQKIKIVISDSTGEKTVLDTLITSDNLNDSVSLKNGKVFIVERSGDETHMKSGGNKNYEYVVVSNDRDSGKETKTITKSFDVTYNSKDTDENGKSEVKTKYFVEKDGTRVTVESNDEQKAKDLMKEIENMLGVKGDKKETVKVEAKKEKTNK